MAGCEAEHFAQGVVAPEAVAVVVGKEYHTRTYCLIICILFLDIEVAAELVLPRFFLDQQIQSSRFQIGQARRCPLAVPVAVGTGFLILVEVVEIPEKCQAGVGVKRRPNSRPR